MLKPDHVRRLAGTMVANGVMTLEVKGNGYALRLVRAPGAGAGRAAVVVPSASPASGLFHPRGADDGLPGLEVGAPVILGEPVGYVAVGPLRFVCVAAASGQLAGPLPAEGQAVGAGDILFTVETET